MALSITLTAAQIKQLGIIADKSMPNEACAFLLGSGNDCIVAQILPVANADNSPYSFSVEPSELISAYDTAERKGLQVIGIFHSHPGKSSPSATDLKFMQINPVVWLIYSSTEKKFAAYRVDGETTKVDVLIRD